MESNNFPFPYFYPAKEVLAEDMRAIGHFTTASVADGLFAVRRSDDYGLVYHPSVEWQMDIGIIGLTLEIRSLVILLPNGRIIVQDKKKSSPLVYRLPEVLAKPHYVFIAHSGATKPSSTNSPANVEIPVYTLHLSDKYEEVASPQYLNALPIAQIRQEYANYYLENTFLMPTQHIKASPLLWQFLQESQAFWVRLTRATHGLLNRTNQVPHNAPLAKVSRFAEYLWLYLAQHKPVLNHLQALSHPSEVCLIWSKLASLVWEYIGDDVGEVKELFQFLEARLRTRVGYHFNHYQFIESAKALAQQPYNHQDIKKTLNFINDFKQHFCEPWIFVCEQGSFYYQTDL